MPWWTIRVFFAGKIVAHEPVRARDFAHACKIAQYIAVTTARDAVALCLFDPRKVSWLILEPASVDYERMCS